MMNRKMTKVWIRIVVVIIGLNGAFILNAQNHPIVSGHELENRWLRISTNFLVEDNLGPILSAITTASQHCYNGIVVTDVKFGFLQEYRNTPRYFNHLHTFLDSARALGMKVYPETVSFGYSESILFNDPNLAEGVPVRQLPLIVENNNGRLVLANDPTDVFPFQNGDFEDVPSSGHEPPGWTWQDGPGTTTFIDDQESKSGRYSMKISNSGQNPAGNTRVVQRVNVIPFRDYHLSLWVKTENLDGGNFNVLLLNTDNFRIHQHNPVNPRPTQDWTRYDLTFNTLDSESIQFYFGIWSGRSGSLWIDDIRIEPTRFNNIVRRPGAPVALENAAGEVLIEGVDTDSILDPLSGFTPWPGSFSIWHSQPDIGIPISSNLKEGDQVFAHYYHTSLINGGQVCASLTEPKVFDITQRQLSDIHDEFVKANIFEGWFLQYDEIRVHNWDESPDYGSPGDNLAYNFERVHQQCRDIDPDGLVMTWSDMFDPFHNAYDSGNPYYLVNGLWDGSWEGVPSSVLIMNWNSGSERRQSADFFAQRGHDQVLAGYYDQSQFYTHSWLEELKGIDGINGVMYTTWRRDFSDLEDWAKQIWGGCQFTTDIVHTKDESNVNIYPNPTDDMIYFELKNQKSLGIQIVDMTGGIMFRSRTIPSCLSVENWVPGLYTIYFEGKSSVEIKRIVIQ